MNSCRLFSRRWMRFNLRTFMVVVAALAIGLGRLGTEVNRATKHRDAINLLATHSADAEVAARAWPKFGTSFMPHLDDWLRQRLGNEYLDTIVGVDLCIGTMTDDDLKSIARHPGLSSIERLRLDSQYVTNEGVANLKAVQRLKTLKLVNVKVDDEGLHFLSNLPNLQRLQLPQRVRGRGLRHLANPGHLLSLDMAHAWVEGASLAPLRKCLNLRWLNLQNTRAVNSSLRHLHDLPKLQYLNVDEIPCKRSRRRRKLYFLPVKVLSPVFRGKFIDLLKRAFYDGRLEFHGKLAYLAQAGAFEHQLNVSVRKKWVVYAKPPFGGPEQVLKYLARYTHRVAISSQRLIDLRDGRVRFRYKDYADQQRTKVLPLTSTEFIRRFLLHTLPSGFVRIRYFGFLANRHRAENLKHCRTLLGTTTDIAPVADPAAEPADASDPPAPHETCPACRHGKLVIIDTIPAPQPVRRPHFLLRQPATSSILHRSPRAPPFQMNSSYVPLRCSGRPGRDRCAPTGRCSLLFSLQTTAYHEPLPSRSSHPTETNLPHHVGLRLSDAKLTRKSD